MEMQRASLVLQKGGGWKSILEARNRAAHHRKGCGSLLECAKGGCACFRRAVHSCSRVQKPRLRRCRCPQWLAWRGPGRAQVHPPCRVGRGTQFFILSLLGSQRSWTTSLRRTPRRKRLSSTLNSSSLTPGLRIRWCVSLEKVEVPVVVDWAVPGPSHLDSGSRDRLRGCVTHRMQQVGVPFFVI